MKRFQFIAGLILMPLIAAAKVVQDFHPRVEISDGKNGRAFRKWTQPIKEFQVHEVRAKLYRRSGGDDCYVNLRFGDGDTFESGKRAFLTTNEAVEVRWSINAAPGGKPLVMNAYNGTVYVRYVTARDAR